jgi:uncharacterized protein with ParB-like and HNH nuclease domain
MNEIKGKEKSIRLLLQNSRFYIDFYQREYKWQTKHLQELIEDLVGKFRNSYQEDDERSEIQNYDNYFLGSIILCEKEGKKFIIDGQQRLTTLTLLLIYLKNILANEAQKVKLSGLIYSDVYGKESFNIEVEERRECMSALFNNERFDVNGASESIQNIFNRYNEIEQLFPDDIDGRSMIYFSDWLLQNVYMVEITAYSDEDAYMIFETMNDRGLSLSPLDMLKGFLLASISDKDNRNKAVSIWKKWSEKLRALGKDEDSDAFKAWLRSQYALSIRERKRGAVAKDFDKIGTEFHRWIKDNPDKLKLQKSEDYFTFINRDMQFYINAYVILKNATQKMTDGLEPVFYNAKLAFTLQYPLLLAPLIPDDDDVTIRKKMNMVSSFLDIIIARRIWNFKSIAYSTMQYAMFNVMISIRNKGLNDLASILRSKIDEEPTTFRTNERLRLHGQNRYYIHYLLARLTDYVEASSGNKSRFAEYMVEGRNRYEVEHIWADHFEQHMVEFNHPADFAEFRNRFGALLLLPKTFNGSYGDLMYSEKKKYYFAQNLLAKSLHHDCYEHNPGFLKFMSDYSLPFKPYDEFNINSIIERQDLYTLLAELLWSPERIRTNN